MAAAKKSPARRVAAKKRAPAKKAAVKRAPARKGAPAKKSVAKKRAPVKRISLPKPPVAPPGEQIFLLDVDFQQQQAASWAGARWSPALKSNIWIGRKLPAELEQYAPAKRSWNEWQQQDLNRTAVTQVPAIDNSTGKYELRSDQIEDVGAVLAARQAGSPEFLIANTTGLGKTAVAIQAIKEMAGVLNVLVICQLTVASNWQDHLRDLGDGGMRWCIMNYESSHKLVRVPDGAPQLKSQKAKNKQVAKLGKSLVEWDVVITDESHLLANPDSLRSQTIENLISGTRKPAFALRLSATAGANPAELSYLHRMFAWKDGRRIGRKIDSEAYKAWCATKGLTVVTAPFGNGMAWDGHDRELTTMSKILFGGVIPAGVRREKSDWPDQERHIHPVELTPAQRTAYEAEWVDFQLAMRTAEKAAARAAEMRESGGPITASGTPASRKRAMKKASTEARDARANGLAAMMHYRQKAGQLRVPGTADLVADLVAAGNQVAVSCQFLATTRKLAEVLEERGIAVSVFTGENRPTREAERIAYQRGERKVIIFTPVEGFNLHAGDVAVDGNSVPRSMVVAEPRWAPKPALQAEGRSQRAGRAAPVHYTYAEGTIEDDVILKVVNGMKNVSLINGADAGPFRDIAQVLGATSVMASDDDVDAVVDGSG